MPTIRISEVHSVNGIKPAVDYAEGLNEFGRINSKNKAHATIRKDLEKHHINSSNLRNRAVLMDGDVNPLLASHDMVRTLHLFNDGGKNKAFRIIQSFDPQKLKYYRGQDIIKAHQAGLKLADQLSHHGKYLYLVCTHIDGGSPGGERPIHNHIIFLGTSLHGKQFRPRHLWTQVARTSDKIAENMQLGVLPDQKITNPKTRKPEKHDINEVKMTQRTHHISKKEYVRQQVDQAMMNKNVISIKDLANYLKPAGIYLKLYSKKTGNELKHLTFIDKKHPSKSGRPFKVRDRTLGSDYLKETIKHGLEQKATATARQRKEHQQSTMAGHANQEFSQLAIRNRNQLITLSDSFKPAITESAKTSPSVHSKQPEEPEGSSILAHSFNVINQADRNLKGIDLKARIIRTQQQLVKQLYQCSEQIGGRIQKRIKAIKSNNKWKPMTTKDKLDNLINKQTLTPTAYAQWLRKKTLSQSKASSAKVWSDKKPKNTTPAVINTLNQLPTDTGRMDFGAELDLLATPGFSEPDNEVGGEITYRIKSKPFIKQIRRNNHVNLNSIGLIDRFYHKVRRAYHESLKYFRKYRYQAKHWLEKKKISFESWKRGLDPKVNHDVHYIHPTVRYHVKSNINTSDDHKTNYTFKFLIMNKLKKANKPFAKNMDNILKSKSHQQKPKFNLSRDNYWHRYCKDQRFFCSNKLGQLDLKKYRKKTNPYLLGNLNDYQSSVEAYVNTDLFNETGQERSKYQIDKDVNKTVGADPEDKNNYTKRAIQEAKDNGKEL